MDFVKYMNIKTRMTNNCKIHCAKCLLSMSNNKHNKPCADFERENPKEAQEIVSNWGQMNPQKTRAQDFFEKHPKAPRDIDGNPEACAYQAGYCQDCDETKKLDCNKCWNEPLEE